MSQQKSNKVGKFYRGNTTFSVYVEMANQLEADGWTPVQEEGRVAVCDLVLGDRKSIPYASLRVEPMAPGSYFGGRRWVNYFLRSNHLTMKAFMAETLRAMDRTCHTWMPETYIIGGNQKMKVDDREGMMRAAEGDPSAIWIIKPGNGAKGKGITMARGPEKIQELIDHHEETSRSVYAIQRYVDRPLLLSHGRKFDIRFWVCLQSPYSIYAFTQASCRTASEPFDLNDIDNIFSHLTNHCLQEQSSAYGRYEEGNEMWLPALETYLTQELHNNNNTNNKNVPDNVLLEHILPHVCNIIVRTLLAMRPEMQVYPEEGYECFQLFGYDVIVEEDFKVQLLEINGSPGIADKWLHAVVREMRRILGCVREEDKDKNENEEKKKEKEKEKGANNNDNDNQVEEKANNNNNNVEKKSNFLERARHWDIHKAELLLLWQVGDEIPEGLSEEVSAI